MNIKFRFCLALCSPQTFTHSSTHTTQPPPPPPPPPIVHFLAFEYGVGITHLTDSPTEMPGAILMQVQVNGAANNFSARANFQCRLLRCPYATVCTNMCAHIKNPKHWQPYHKRLHTLTAMGGAALVAAVPYLGKVT